MEKKRKKPYRSKADRDAWNAHVDETIARMRGLAEKAWAEIQEKKRAAGGPSPPRTEP
jgi:hypothetical protein